MIFQAALSKNVQILKKMPQVELARPKGRMFAIQAALPKFPVAPLEQTMEKYLQTVRPLLTDIEFENTKKVGL